MVNSKRLKILLAPLDWGLGHATRCIPIIKILIQRGHEITIAAEGRQKMLLQQEFSSLQFIDLPGYNIKYGDRKRLSIFKIIIQTPKILIQINHERKWLNNYLLEERPDIIISDNRFGLVAPGICSVFITHQLHINAPFGKMISRALTAWNYKYISRFSVCWIPDFERSFSLAGKLDHPKKLPGIPMRYIGPLTRFVKLDIPIIKDSLLVIISGPEPQRSSFENKLIAQLKNYNGKVVFLRALPGNNEMPLLAPNIIVYNHLSTEALNRAMCEAEFIISRSGYSTVMDIVGLGKKSILVPTPAQPEQEYLASYLFEKKIIFTVEQDKFVLQTCLDAAKKFPFITQDKKDESLLANAIDELSSCLHTEMTVEANQRPISDNQKK